MADIAGGNVIWHLDADKGKLSSSLASARQEIEQTAKTGEQKFSGMASTIVKSFKDAEEGSKAFAKGLLVVGTTATAALGFGIKMAADTETARQGFVTLLGSAEKADEAIKMIKKDAAATPFELPGLIRANQLLSSVTKDAERSEGILLNVGKALAAAGKGGAELDNVIVNLQQIANTGRITEMDIRQFGFAGINILELLADQYGVTKEQAGEMVKDSKDAFTDLEKAFQKAGGEGGRFSRAFIDQAGTWNQLVSNFKDVFGQTAGEIAQSTGAFNAVKGALGGIIDSLVKFQPQIIEGITKFMTFIGDNGPIVAGVIIGGLIPAFVGLAGAIVTLMAPLIPFIVVGAAVGLAVKLILDAFGGFENMKNTIGNVVNSIVGFFQSIPGFFASVWESIKTGFNDFVTFVSAIPERVGNYFAELPLRIAYGLGFAIGTIIAWGVGVYNYLKENVPLWIDSITTYFSELPGRMSTFLVDTYNRFIEWGGNVLTFIGSLPGRISNSLSNLGPTLKTSFTGAWSNILNEVRQWPDRLREWGGNIGNAFLDGIKNALKNLRDAFVRGLNDAKASIQGQSPPKEGPFKEIDKWGFNIGDAWVKGMQSAMSTLSVPDFGANPMMDVVNQSTPDVEQSESVGGFTQQNNIDQVILNNEMDVDTMLRGFSFAYRTRGDLG